MIPTLALQEAVRARLLADPMIVQHVEPARIRMAAVRPEQLPAIHLSPTRTSILGRASGGQIVAEVSQLLHLWAVQDGSGTVEQIAAAAVLALMDAPEAKGFAFDAFDAFDAWDRPVLVWSDQPGLDGAAHGAIALRAVIRRRE